MGRFGLRLRFGIATLLLVATTVTASVWTLAALSRLNRVVTDTVRQSEAVTAVTSQLAGALEREDDGVLLVLAGDQRGRSVLAEERSVVDKAVAALFDVLGPADERELATPLEAELKAYRRAADDVVNVAPERDALVQYHQKANPLLRRAVALTTVIRDRHFELARHAVTDARDQASASRRVVLLITIAALVFAVIVSWYLTTTVVGPLRRLTRGANAIREGRFDERIELTSTGRAGGVGVRVQSNGGKPCRVPPDQRRRSRASEEHARGDSRGAARCRRAPGRHLSNPLHEPGRDRRLLRGWRAIDRRPFGTFAWTGWMVRLSNERFVWEQRRRPPST